MNATTRKTGRWAALTTVAALLVLCLVLLGSQVSAAQPEPPPQRPPELFDRSPADLSQNDSPEDSGDWDGRSVSWPCVVQDGTGYKMWYLGYSPSNPGYGAMMGLAESSDGTTWTKSPSNPVLGVGDPGAWDSMYRGQIACMKDGGIYKMWYSGGGTSGPWQTGYATSTDGIDWDIYSGNPVLASGGSGSWDDVEADGPTVIKDGGLYKMWYYGCNADYSLCSIGYATSTDGVNWTKYAGNPVLNPTAGTWDEGGLVWPRVVKSDGTYQMWYRAGSQSGLATSTDGVNWTKYAGNPILTEGWDGASLSIPWVILEDSTYRMWARSGSGESAGIGYLESTDGIAWTQPVENPVLEPGEPGLPLEVNYAHDWVQVRAIPDSAVTIAVLQPGGARMTNSGQTDDGGYFSTNDQPWDPERPDIAPGDHITGTLDGLAAEVDPVGAIEGRLDPATNSFQGTVHAEWFSPDTLDVRCEVWDQNGPRINVSGVAADGGSFTCDFGALGWQLQPNTDVAVRYFEPDGDSVMNVFQLPVTRVNYGDDWVGADYPAGHTFSITVTDNTGAVKGLAEVDSEPWGGWGGPGFSTWDEHWLAGRPDIIAGDQVHAQSDDGYQSAIRVGQISGDLDVDADTISGNIYADWFTQTLDMWCNVWVDNGPPGIGAQVDPDGGSYVCDFGAQGWDILPGQNVAVMYNEPDGNMVINTFQGPAPNMRIEKWVEGNNETAPGGRSVFALRYRNDGDAAAAAGTVVLTDTLPPDTQYVTDSSGLSPTVGQGWLRWELGAVDVDEEILFHLVLDNSADAGDTLTNRARIYHPWDSGDWNDEAETEVRVAEGQPDLCMNKYKSTDYPAPGQTFLFYLDYCNDGSVPSGPALMTDTLPAGLSIVSWHSENGYNLWQEVSRDNGSLVLAAPSVPANWSDRILLRVRVDPSLEPGTGLQNEAEISTAGDENPDNNWDDTGVEVGQPHWNARLWKEFGWGTLAPGGEINYRLQLSNDGNMAAGSTLTDTLPAGAAFDYAWLWQEGVNVPFPPDQIDGQTLIWDLGQMEPGDRHTLHIKTHLAGSLAAGTTLTNCASLAIDGQDDWPFDNHACVTDTIRAPGPNLRLYKTAEWDGDDQIRYRIYFENVGTTDLQDVWITDTYPPTTTISDWWPNYHRWITATKYPNQHQIAFWVEEIQRRDTGQINLRVELDSELVGQQGLAFGNKAEAPIAGDVDPADNTAQVTAYTGPDLYATKWLHDGELRAGERITFTIRGGNDSDWDMSDETIARLTDRLPAGMTYVDALWPDGSRHEPLVGEPGDSIVIWDMGRQNNWDRFWFYLVVDLDEGLSPGTVLVNRLEIEGRPPTDTDPLPGNNTFLYSVTLEGERIYLPVIVRSYP